MRCSYVWNEGRVQHVGLQPFEVDVSEDGVLLDLYGPAPLATQSLLGVLGQELRCRRRGGRRKADISTATLKDYLQLAQLTEAKYISH